jgi:DinB superfamily
MNKSIHQSALIFRLNGRLFHNTLKGISDEQARERISDHNNPLNWLGTHTVWARYNTCALLGKQVDNPYKGLFENFKPFDPADEYPSLAAISAEWDKASALLNEALETVTDEHLAGPAPFKNPLGDDTLFGAVTFLAQHESYDIGQMALLKKYLSKEAMSYS